LGSEELNYVRWNMSASLSKGESWARWLWCWRIRGWSWCCPVSWSGSYWGSDDAGLLQRPVHGLLCDLGWCKLIAHQILEHTFELAEVTSHFLVDPGGNGLGLVVSQVGGLPHGGPHIRLQLLSRHFTLALVVGDAGWYNEGGLHAGESNQGCENGDDVFTCMIAGLLCDDVVYGMGCLTG
jgi:hypothetical protein